MSYPAARKKRFIAAHPFCAKCAAVHTQRNPLTIDHVVPRAKGGAQGVSNWQVLCQRCNYRKGAKLESRGHIGARRPRREEIPSDIGVLLARRYL